MAVWPKVAAVVLTIAALVGIGYEAGAFHKSLVEKDLELCRGELADCRHHQCPVVTPCPALHQVTLAVEQAATTPGGLTLSDIRGVTDPTGPVAKFTLRTVESAPFQVTCTWVKPGLYTVCNRNGQGGFRVTLHAIETAPERLHFDVVTVADSCTVPDDDLIKEPRGGSCVVQ